MEYGMELKQPSKRALSEFSSLKEFNEQIDFILKNYELTKTERALLTLLSQHAVKYLGVCYLSVEKIAEKLGKKVSTINELLCKLKKRGFIRRHKPRNKGGKFGVRWTIFVAKTEVVNLSGEAEKNDETPCAPTGSENEQKEETIFLKQNTLELDYNSNKIVEKTVGKPFYKAFAHFLGNEGTVKLHNYVKNIYKQTSEAYNEILDIDLGLVKDAFDTTRLYKSMNRINQSFENYFWSVLKDKLAKKCERRQRSQYYKAVEANKHKLYDVFS